MKSEQLILLSLGLMCPIYFKCWSSDHYEGGLKLVIKQKKEEEKGKKRVMSQFEEHERRDGIVEGVKKRRWKEKGDEKVEEKRGERKKQRKEWRVDEKVKKNNKTKKQNKRK